MENNDHVGIEQFAKEFKYKGVTVLFKEESLALADAWARTLLASHLLNEGLRQVKLGQTLIKSTGQPEQSSLIV